MPGELALLLEEQGAVPHVSFLEGDRECKTGRAEANRHEVPRLSPPICVREALRHHRSRKWSAARTSASIMAGSEAEWPASGATSNSAPGQRRWSSQAVTIGHTMS